MRDRHQGAHSSVDVAGVWFELEELRRLQAIGVADVRVEILATNVAYEEVVLFRRGGSPAPILATLHKAPDGDLVVTRLDDARLATPRNANRLRDPRRDPAGPAAHAAALRGGPGALPPDPGRDPPSRLRDGRPSGPIALARWAPVRAAALTTQSIEEDRGLRSRGQSIGEAQGVPQLKGIARDDRPLAAFAGVQGQSPWPSLTPPAPPAGRARGRSGARRRGVGA